MKRANTKITYMTGRSRLAQKKEARNLRQAVSFGLLTVAIALALLFLGIPALIRLAVFVGEIRQSSNPVEVADTVSPPPVRLQPPPEATSATRIKLEGFAEAGSTVKIFVNNQNAREVLADTSGKFMISNLTLREGENEIYAIATDPAGNTGAESSRCSVLVDTEPPEIEILEPSENAEIYGLENKTTIKGKTEASASIRIDDRLIVVNREGEFSYSLTLADGENKITITATDPAGNQAEKELTIIYSP